MQEKPVISLILPSVYPSSWMTIYRDLNAMNKIKFEIIAIGPVMPDFELPDNFRYYYSEVKIPQCIEAGIRLSEGEYIVVISDDSEFRPNFLNNLDKNIQENDMDKTFFVIQAARHWKPKIGSLYYKSRHKNIPEKDRVYIGLYNCYKKSVVQEMGGLDRRFIITLWNCDLNLRYYAKGYSAVLAKNVLICEIDLKDRPHSLRWKTDLINADIEMNDSLWEDDNGEIDLKRKLPLEPFEGSIEELLGETQGPKGIW